VPDNPMTDAATETTTDAATETTTETTAETTAETAIDELAELISEWVTLPHVAGTLGVDVVKVREMLRERDLVALRRGGVLLVPAELLQEGHVVKGLSGLLTVLSDNGFSDAEAVRWLFTADDSLPGRPVDALRENRGTEVRRRAQALGY